MYIIGHLSFLLPYVTATVRTPRPRAHTPTRSRTSSTPSSPSCQSRLSWGFARTSAAERILPKLATPLHQTLARGRSARILLDVDNATQFPTAGHFAAYAALICPSRLRCNILFATLKNR